MLTCLDPQDQDNSFNMDSKCNTLRKCKYCTSYGFWKPSCCTGLTLCEARNGERRREVLQIREKKQKEEQRANNVQVQPQLTSSSSTPQQYHHAFLTLVCGYEFISTGERLEAESKRRGYVQVTSQ